MKSIRSALAGTHFSARNGGFALIPILASLAGSVLAQELPRPAEIEPDIRFWTRVYTEIDTSAGFIHDDRHLNVVYRTVTFDDNVSQRSRNSQISGAFDDIREPLRILATGKRDNLTDREQQILSLWPDDISNRTLASAVDRLRFQRGQSDRFRAGLIRAGRWKPYIRGVLREEGVPADLIDNLDHYTAGADKETERPKRSIEEILEDHARQVPPEEWSKLPGDLIERLDHYTSGADL